MITLLKLFTVACGTGGFSTDWIRVPEGFKNWQLVVIVHGRISTTAGNVQLYTTWDTATATAVGSTVLLSTVAVNAQDISSGMGPMVRLTFVVTADSAATISVYLTPKSE
jgi:hypothetical protein